MSKEELPSINDYLEGSDLPSYKDFLEKKEELPSVEAVSYTHLRAHET